MAEAPAMAVPLPREQGPAARLMELLEQGNNLEAESEATGLTVEIATEAAEWPEFGPKLKCWWIEQYKKKKGDRAAQEAEQIWLKAEADARKLSDVETEITEAAVAEAVAEPAVGEAEPAKAKCRTLA